MVQKGALQCFSAKGVVDAILFGATRSYCGWAHTRWPIGRL